VGSPGVPTIYTQFETTGTVHVMNLDCPEGDEPGSCDQAGGGSGGDGGGIGSGGGGGGDPPEENETYETATCYWEHTFFDDGTVETEFLGCFPN